MKENLLGWSVVEEAEIRCPKCQCLLINVVVSESNAARIKRGLPPLTSSYKVSNCCRCGSVGCWSKRFAGTTAVSAPNDNSVLDIVATDVTDGVICNEVQIKRRKK